MGYALRLPLRVTNYGLWMGTLNSKLKTQNSELRTQNSSYPFLPFSHAPLLTLRQHILVDPEQVVGIVLRLHLGQPLVVAAVAGLHPFLTFLHHEVDVRAAARVWVHVIPVADGPVAKNVLLGWIRIDADDDAGPVRRYRLEPIRLPSCPSS